MIKHHDGKFFESLNLLFIDLLKFQSWIFLILAEVQNTMSSAHFWTFSGFFGFFGIYTLRKKSGRTGETPGALVRCMYPVYTSFSFYSLQLCTGSRYGSGSGIHVAYWYPGIQVSGIYEYTWYLWIKVLLCRQYY